jgi:hypothetical protein
MVTMVSTWLLLLVELRYLDKPRPGLGIVATQPLGAHEVACRVDADSIAFMDVIRHPRSFLYAPTSMDSSSGSSGSSGTTSRVLVPRLRSVDGIGQFIRDLDVNYPSFDGLSVDEMRDEATILVRDHHPNVMVEQNHIRTTRPIARHEELCGSVRAIDIGLRLCLYSPSSTTRYRAFQWLAHDLGIHSTVDHRLVGRDHRIIP